MRGSNRRDTVLAPLREEIGGIDRALLLLVAERRDRVARLMQVKQRYRLPLIDPAQERRVRNRGQRWANELGLSATMADQLFRLVLRECTPAAVRLEREISEWARSSTPLAASPSEEWPTTVVPSSASRRLVRPVP